MPPAKTPSAPETPSTPMPTSLGGIAAPYTQDYRKPYTQSDVKTLGPERYAEEFTGPGKVLADLGVDALLAEYVGYIEDCVAAVDALATIGLPVFLGVRHITEYGWMQYGETLTDLAKALEGHPVEGILLMCSSPRVHLRRFDRPKPSPSMEWSGPTPTSATTPWRP